MSMEYGVKDIQTLEGIEAIRKRPGMYIGSITQSGLQHITLEIISNAIDEYLNGYCTTCRIFVKNNGEITIEDNGRGIPFGLRPDGTETLEAIFTQLHTGAKFDSTGKTGYNTSGGMNGVGAKATNALSEYFQVISRRDGKQATMKFAKGVRKSFEVISISKEIKGTTITFKPDPEIFQEGSLIDIEPMKKQVQELAFLTPGLYFTITYDNKTEEIFSKNGLLDYLNFLNKQEPLTNAFHCKIIEGKLGAEVALLYNNSFTDTYKLYTNLIPNSGGTHLTGFRTALTQSINEYARGKNLLKEKDGNLTGEELKEGLVLVLSFIMPDPIFTGQTKDVLNSSEARIIVQRLVSKEIKIWLENNHRDAKIIIEKALLARKARESARKAKENARKVGPTTSRTILPGTLADCHSKNRQECELFIVEGDSAAGTTKDARDRATQAVLPVRGKIINTIKADLSKILGNNEIQAMITAFGLTIANNRVVVDTNKLRYGKIIMTADADIDGSHIRVLFLTFIWKFCPELIEKGYVYAAIPPLYRIISGKNDFYLKDDAALQEYREKATKKYEVFRLKGLGEMDAEEMEQTVMSKSTRTLKQITMTDLAAANITFNALMGDSAVQRKIFIEKNAFRARLDI